MNPPNKNSANADVRLGLPSASKFDQVYFCPGSVQLIESLNLQETAETPDFLAERGTRIHKAWETDNRNGLDEDEIADLEILIRLEKETLTQWEAGFGKATVALREQRLWLHDDDLNPVLSGQFDRLYLTEGAALVMDAKTGWCKRLTPAQSNWQLRLLALLVANEYGIEHNITSFWLSFLKPKGGREKTEIVGYTIDDLNFTQAEVSQALWASRQPGARRIPGAHCFYCPAKAFCPEAGLFASLPSVAGAQWQPATPLEPEQAVSRLSLEDCKAIWQRSGEIEKILEAIKTRLKGLDAHQLEVLGLCVGKGRKTTTLTRPAMAMAALQQWARQNGLTDLTPIYDAVKLTKKNLLDGLTAATGKKKSVLEREIYDDVLFPFLGFGETKGSLEEL